MKNKKMTIMMILLIASVVLNIVLCVILINTKISTKGTMNNNKTSYYGLYQTSYYNNYNKQIILTVRLNSDGTCRYGEAAAEYAGEGSSDCTYSIDGKNITLNLYSESTHPQEKKGQILDSGMLFINGKQMSKID